GRCSLTQKDRATADAFQALATRLGYRTSIGRHSVSGCWEVYCSPCRWVDLRSGTAGDTPATGSAEYHGTVWCPSVSTGFWVARRGDIPFVTGNTYPPELCERPVEAMCPRRVCRTCGAPSRRVAETTNAVGHAVGRTAWTRDAATAALMHSGAITIDANHPDVPDRAERLTTGWTTCGCPGADGIRLDGFHSGVGWRPGVVLDPFAGSGTTLLVAHGRGRDSIGVDLTYVNAGLAMKRVGVDLDVHWPEGDVTLPALSPGSPDFGAYGEWAPLMDDYDPERAMPDVLLAGLPRATRRQVPVLAGQGSLLDGEAPDAA
ncbi:MAG TPA: DNA methyltransferase, partial [Propionibacteriaceae bacterium]|nr:DNA methyltransferase [Propionibacteriaceae bacterium]